MRNRKSIKGLIVLINLIMVSVYYDPALADIKASRLIGVAPLGVNFSAGADSSTAGNRPFHERLYSWDFGNPTSDIWAVSGKSKNTANGPITAHIFETPGTYVVSLTVADGNGPVSTEQVEIMVQDPDEIYSGGNTICFSDTTNNDFQGCPSGAVQIATDDISAIKSEIATGKRILLGRGSSWTSTGVNSNERNIGHSIEGPVTIGAYGPRLNPDERGICENAPEINLEYPIAYGEDGYQYPGLFAISRTNDWRIHDINFNANTDYNSLSGGATDVGPFLFLRVKSSGFRTMISLSHYKTAGHDQFMIVDSDLSGAYNNVVYTGSENLVLMGNDIRDAATSHVVRVWQAYSAVISHNRLSGSSLTNNRGRAALKLHGLREELLDTEYGILKRTRLVVLADNLFGGSGPWPVCIAPQNAVRDERLSDIVVENNRFLSDYGNLSSRLVSVPLSIHARDVSVRNNIIDGNGGGNGFKAIVVSKFGIEPQPTGIQIYNNTILKTEVNDPAYGYRLYAGIEVEDTGEDITIMNNLVVFPEDDFVDQIFLIRNRDSSIITESHNLLIQTNDHGLKDPENADPIQRDYSIKEDSPAIDFGTTVPVFNDFSGAPRPITNPYDAGAFENQAIPDPEPEPDPEFSAIYTGIGPFGVNFAAVAFDDPQIDSPFHNKNYTWNFGDPSSGTWAISDKPRNSAQGPVTAHIFETPGTYVVTLTVTENGETSDTQYFQVVVEDPDEIYAGSDTICFSDSENNDFQGCPESAMQIVTDDVSDIKLHIDTGKRILLGRGSTWASTGTDPGERNIGRSIEGPVTIGAYGNCQNPDERGICENAPEINLEYPIAYGEAGYQYPSLFAISQTNDWRIHDINFHANTDYNSLAGGATDIGPFLFLRVKSQGFRTMIALSHYRTAGHDQFMIVDSDLSGAENNVVYAGSEHLVLMGNDIRDAATSHVVRIWQAYSGVISHNSLSGSSLNNNRGRHALKLHGIREELLDTEWGILKRTRLTVIADNVFGGSGPWSVAIGPQNVLRDERLSDLIIENNRFLSDYGNLSSRLVSIPLSIHAKDVSIRNNIIDGNGGAGSILAIKVSKYGIEPSPSGIQIFNNTIIKTEVHDPNGSYRLYSGIDVEDTGEGITIMNNLVVFPEDAFADQIFLIRNRDNSIINESHNLLIQSDDHGLKMPDHSAPLLRDYSLEGFSPAIDQGVTLPVFTDFSGAPRDINMPFDIGAFEY